MEEPGERPDPDRDLEQGDEQAGQDRKREGEDPDQWRDRRDMREPLELLADRAGPRGVEERPIEKLVETGVEEGRPEKETKRDESEVEALGTGPRPGGRAARRRAGRPAAGGGLAVVFRDRRTARFGATSGAAARIARIVAPPGGGWRVRDIR